jgi:hypothetical protein
MGQIGGIKCVKSVKYLGMKLYTKSLLILKEIYKSIERFAKYFARRLRVTDPVLR